MQAERVFHVCAKNGGRAILEGGKLERLREAGGGRFKKQKRKLLASEQSAGIGWA